MESDRGEYGSPDKPGQATFNFEKVREEMAAFYSFVAVIIKQPATLKALVGHKTVWIIVY